MAISRPKIRNDIAPFSTLQTRAHAWTNSTGCRIRACHLAEIRDLGGPQDRVDRYPRFINACAHTSDAASIKDRFKRTLDACQTGSALGKAPIPS